MGAVVVGPLQPQRGRAPGVHHTGKAAPSAVVQPRPHHPRGNPIAHLQKSSDLRVRHHRRATRLRRTALSAPDRVEFVGSAEVELERATTAGGASLPLLGRAAAGVSVAAGIGRRAAASGGVLRAQNLDGGGGNGGGRDLVLLLS